MYGSKTLNTELLIIVPKICIYCALYKIVHGCDIDTCAELFVVGPSTILTIIQEFVHGMNIVFKDLIS
jgi:hypothetical protein